MRTGTTVPRRSLARRGGLRSYARWVATTVCQQSKRRNRRPATRLSPDTPTRLVLGPEPRSARGCHIERRARIRRLEQLALSADRIEFTLPCHFGFIAAFRVSQAARANICRSGRNPATGGTLSRARESSNPTRNWRNGGVESIPGEWNATGSTRLGAASASSASRADARPRGCASSSTAS